MNSTAADSPESERERLEAEAERMRARLTSDIDELKRRGRRVVDGVSAVRAQVKSHPLIALGAAAGCVVVLGFVLRARNARRRRAERRALLLGIAGRVLGPAYVKPPEPRASAVKNAIMQTGKELAVAAGRELGRRALLAVADGAEPGASHPAEGPA